MIFSDDFQSPESNEFRTLDRRGVLGNLGILGLGVLASSTSAGAFTSHKGGGSPKISVQTASRSSSSRSAIALPDLPDEWARNHGAVAASYLKYLNGLKLKRVDPAQMVGAHAKAKGSTWNSLPPKAWWKRMGYALKVVDRIAEEMNVSSVEVISAYRNPRYNARCPGAKSGSWHQANVAVDVKFPVRASKVTATARELRDLGLFHGGVGGYWNFTHIDCRGKNINW